ncbi:thioredoxin fold domain-containing protein [Idiomarina sp. HP20-50]|uniref:thioredoxin fold domain-containing protein n=1 Tax=Idiomarina sp. HP20-50 TaxID=3070813 RepID=UPI00294B72C6|nr:thioredoxin fold domain-containing protein [Idiomarina sp. HP20-50]MDV6315358.1 thioredoxin fold domain-containing protein [Idiomarina sp. HP20-50]
MRNLMSVVGLVGLVSASFSVSALSAGQSEIDTRHLNKVGIEVLATESGEIDGYVRAVTNQGMFYVSKDGERLISGNVFDITGSEPKNLSEAAMAKVRLKMLKGFTDDMIVYPAENEKYQVTVFTDTTCGYCQRLHENMDSYHAEGITIKYLAFPRGGMNSTGGQQLQTVWCSDDKKAAITAFKEDENYSGSSSCSNPVAEHYQLGKSFGVTGTPAIVLPDGRLLPGAVPAARLAAEIRKGQSQ